MIEDSVPRRLCDPRRPGARSLASDQADRILTAGGKRSRAARLCGPRSSPLEHARGVPVFPAGAGIAGAIPGTRPDMSAVVR